MLVSSMRIPQQSLPAVQHLPWPHLYLSLGYLGFLGASKVLGLWKTVLYLGLRDCLHVLLLTDFKAFKA